MIFDIIITFSRIVVLKRDRDKKKAANTQPLDSVTWRHVSRIILLIVMQTRSNQDPSRF